MDPHADSVATTVRLGPEMDVRLSEEAKRLRVTRSAVVRFALDAWMGDGSTPGPSPRASDES